MSKLPISFNCVKGTLLPLIKALERPSADITLRNIHSHSSFIKSYFGNKKQNAFK